jgi:hypothetical protein
MMDFAPQLSTRRERCFMPVGIPLFVAIGIWLLARMSGRGACSCTWALFATHSEKCKSGRLTGSLPLTVPVIGFIALMLAGVNAGLMLFGIALFDRESILTRWK